MSTFAKLNYKSDLYSKFRPAYSNAVFQTMYKFHQHNNNDKQAFNTALDVGTGTGQIAKELASKFKQVYGTDSSATMLSNALKADNIQYSVAKAEDLASTFEASSIDVMTVGQAFHWFDQARFFKDAQRILTPHGTLAIVGYGFVQVQNHPAASQLILDLGDKTLKEYWEPGRELLNNLYRDTQFPFETVEWHITPSEADTTHLNKTEHEESFMATKISLQRLSDYLKTWSSYFNYLKKTNDPQDPVDKVIQEIQSVMQLKDMNEMIPVEWPTVLILCKNQK